MKKNRILFDYIKIVLSNILQIVELEDIYGKKLEVYGFKKKDCRYRNSIKRNNKNREDKGVLRYQSIDFYTRLEPRIRFLKKYLEEILACIDLTDEANNVLYPYSFRLKELKEWLVPLHINDFLGQLAWQCTVKCEFCYQKGLHAKMRTRGVLSIEEIMTRLKYYNPGKAVGLTQGTIFNGNEKLNNPHIFEILRKLRDKNKNIPFGLSTNGERLTEANIRKLVDLKPIQIHLSLNSANPGTRKAIMHDFHPEIAVNSVQLLEKYKLPFAVSCVLWPTIRFSDITKTITYAADHNALFFIAWMPGYSKYFSKEKLFDALKFWDKSFKYLNDLRDKVSIPIIYPPASMLYEKNKYHVYDLPHIHGVIKHSPAYNSGIRNGDLVLEINNERTNGRETARQLLEKYRDKEIKLLLQRKGEIFDVTLKKLKKKEYRYPYTHDSSKFIFPFGIIMLQGIDYRYLQDIEDYIKIYSAKNVLVLTSKIIRPVLEHLLEKQKTADNSKANIFVEVPRNEFFGGSVIIGDLLVVDDFIKAINKWKKKHRRKPDLILIPASPFSNWGRDLIGEINLDIERTTGVPVEFIHNEPIWA
jgi:MoaA/NifB/PqqE/SkfB family radical SAM enzyme